MKTVLFSLVSFVAVSATFCGLWLMSNPDSGFMNLPYGLLEGTPFTSFLVPGILLTVLVGGINFLAALSNLQQYSNRYNWSVCGGVLTASWVILEMALNRTTYWLQWVYLVTGLLIILVAYQLKGKWAL